MSELTPDIRRQVESAARRRDFETCARLDPENAEAWRIKGPVDEAYRQRDYETCARLDVKQADMWLAMGRMDTIPTRMLAGCGRPSDHYSVRSTAHLQGWTPLAYFSHQFDERDWNANLRRMPSAIQAPKRTNVYRRCAISYLLVEKDGVLHVDVMRGDDRNRDWGIKPELPKLTDILLPADVYDYFKSVVGPDRWPAGAAAEQPTTQTVRDLPLGSYIMIASGDRPEVPFLKDEEERLTRLSDAAYLGVGMFEGAKFRVVTPAEAIAAARAERQSVSRAFREPAPVPVIQIAPEEDEAADDDEQDDPSP